MKLIWNKPNTDALYAFLLERHAKALKALGEEISSRRKSINMSIPELAERSGATVADIEKLERGEEVESQTAKAVLTKKDHFRRIASVKTA